jgi:DNA-binding transcriptional LysR family regulator
MKLSTIDLRLFAAIADLGGITAAARKLGLTKSLVSRELAALEERLGTRLVQRTTRRVSLTDSGELLAIYARRVVEEVENAEAAIEAKRETPRGALTVSVPFSILRFVLIPRLSEFRRAYPEIRLNLDATMRVTNLIDEGIDVAIRIGELMSSSLVARRLAATPIILVAAPDYLARHGLPQEPDTLAGHQLLSLGRSVEHENWVLSNSGSVAASLAVTPTIAVHDPGLLLDLAIQGLGIAPVPLIYARSAIAERRVTHVLPEFSRGTAPIHAVYPSRRLLAPKVRAFIEFAVDAFGHATR